MSPSLVHAPDDRHGRFYRNVTCALDRPSPSRLAAMVLPANPQSAIRNPQWDESAIRNPRSEPPLVLVRTVASRQEVVGACDQAAADGVRPGMTLAEARALCSGLEHAEHDPRRDVLGLEALGRWMTRFTPVVAIDTPGAPEHSDGARDLFQPVMDGGYYNRLVTFRAEPPRKGGPPHRHAIFLDITGCGRVFHGLDNLVGQVATALKRMRLDARLAVAPTPGAAWAMTFAPPPFAPPSSVRCSVFDVRCSMFASESDTENRTLSPRHPNSLLCAEGAGGPLAFPMVCLADLRHALAPLPPAVLRLDGDIVAALHHLGVDTIARLLALPREALPARFGPLLTRRLDQAMGRLAEPLVPLPHYRPVQAAMDFGGVVESLETVWFAFKQLVGDVVRDLARRGCGARQMEVIMLRDGAPPLARTIDLSRPSRSRANLFELIRCATERLEDNRPGRPPHRQACPPGRQEPPPHRQEYPSHPGFTGVRLRVPMFERLTEAQARLHDDDEAAGQEELACLTERLAARLGDAAVARTQLVESHLPERAWAEDSGFRVQGSGFRGQDSGVKGRVNRQVSLVNRGPSSLHPEPRTLNPPSRPLRMLPAPVEVRVIAEPSDDCNGRPRQFTGPGGAVHRLTHAIGPERIGGEWWRGHTKTRDYYDVEDIAGRRFWLFRVVRNGSARWFVHGGFE